jgi:hypothetical protein
MQTAVDNKRDDQNEAINSDLGSVLCEIVPEYDVLKKHFGGNKCLLLKALLTIVNEPIDEQTASLIEGELRKSTESIEETIADDLTSFASLNGTSLVVWKGCNYNNKLMSPD